MEPIFLEAPGSLPIVEPVAEGALVTLGLLAWLPACLVVYAVLRGRNQSLRNFVVAVPTLLPGVVGLAVAVGVGLNGLLDRGDETGFDVEVIHLSTMTTRRSGNETTSYRVTLAPWRPGWAPVSLDVSAEQSAILVPGHHVRVITRAGWLGWEWVADFRPVAGLPER